MFHNVGGSIKNWAVGVFLVEAAAAVGGGLAYCIYAEENGFWGLLMMVGGVLAAYFSAMLLYGFGEQIEKTARIEKLLSRQFLATAAGENAAVEPGEAERMEREARTAKEMIEEVDWTPREYDKNRPLSEQLTGVSSGRRPREK